MLGKRKPQASFMDIDLANRRKACTWLEQIDKMINWKPMERQLKKLYPSNLGRPSYPPITMFKALLLAQWYDLSDPALEEQLLDRRSFQDFCGIGTYDEVPDETSFVIFRQRLMKKGLDKKMFDYINRQIEEAGHILKHGTLVDATLVASAVKKPPRRKEGEEDKSKDPEANWGVKKGQQPIYGYKLHIGADQRSQIIRKLEVTAANVGDSECFDELLSGDEGAVFADKGYMNKGRIHFLRGLDIYPGIMRKAYRNNPLKPSRLRKNCLYARIRGPVESLFGRAKRLYGFGRTRYIGLRKNILKARMLAMAMNLDRARALTYA